MLLKCCTQYARKFGKLSSGHKTGKRVFIQIPKKGNAKEHSNYCAIALISHVSKVIFKILQARLQQYMNWELPNVQAGFRKGRGTRDQVANIHWIIVKAREFQKKHLLQLHWAFSIARLVKNLPAVQETPVRYLSQEYPVEKGSSPAFLGFPCGSAGKVSAYNVGDLGSISGLERSPGEGKGYPLQYSGLENFMDSRVHWVPKSRKPMRDFHFHFLLHWLQQSLWLSGSQQTVENSLRDGNTRTPYLPPEKSVCRSRSNS